MSEDGTVIGDEEDGEVPIGQQRGAVPGAVVDDNSGKGLKSFLRDSVPQFAGKGEVADIDIYTRLLQHGCYKILVHRGAAAMGI